LPRKISFYNNNSSNYQQAPRSQTTFILITILKKKSNNLSVTSGKEKNLKSGKAHQWANLRHLTKIVKHLNKKKENSKTSCLKRMAKKVALLRRGTSISTLSATQERLHIILKRNGIGQQTLR